MNKVTQLSQEIAATLRARSVRIIAPIPGKSTIGIEVPNTNRRMVRISELVSQKAYDKGIMALPMFLGMDAEGMAIVEDLARMPHLLIAGTTGSGKSVCINTILASILLTRSRGASSRKKGCQRKWEWMWWRQMSTCTAWSQTGRISRS